jgi:hypothetical protein
VAALGVGLERHGGHPNPSWRAPSTPARSDAKCLLSGSMHQRGARRCFRADGRMHGADRLATRRCVEMSGSEASAASRKSNAENAPIRLLSRSATTFFDPISPGNLPVIRSILPPGFTYLSSSQPDRTLLGEAQGATSDRHPLR